MTKLRKILLIALVFVSFLASLIVYMPAWVVGSLAYKYSQYRITTVAETGSFWHGEALLIALDAEAKNSVPVARVGWQVKLGLSKWVSINFTSADHPIAKVSLDKSGLSVNNLDLSLAMDQLLPFFGSLSALSLSGVVHVTADQLHLSKTNTGDINVKLENVGSGIAPVNPLGSYNVQFNLSTNAITVDSSSDSALSVRGSGNLNSLVLNSKVQAMYQEKLLQFMTMMGIPQADGSYQLKVF